LRGRLANREAREISRKTEDSLIQVSLCFHAFRGSKTQEESKPRSTRNSAKTEGNLIDVSHFLRGLPFWEEDQNAKYAKDHENQEPSKLGLSLFRVISRASRFINSRRKETAKQREN